MNEAAADDIARIEARIEQLTLSIERCRKLSLAAKAAVAAGVLWLVMTLLWVVPFVPAMLFAALAAIIGGVVLLGSNATTWTQTEAALHSSEVLRAEMIERLTLRTVDAGVSEIH